MSDGLSCPFCGSAAVDSVSSWGGQLITRQVRCQDCNAYFEALRSDFDSASGVGELPGDRGSSAVRR
jgi:hypothetical protein